VSTEKREADFGFALFISSNDKYDLANVTQDAPIGSGRQSRHEAELLRKGSLSTYCIAVRD
jgi:hypothetical protein